MLMMLAFGGMLPPVWVGLMLMLLAFDGMLPPGRCSYAGFRWDIATG